MYPEALKYQPALHPTVLSSTPPSTSPMEKPRGCERPRNPNAIFRALPACTCLVKMLTELVRQRLLATPWSARNTINSIAVRARPEAKVKHPKRQHPIDQMRRGPTTSPTEPARRRRDPEVRALTEDGHKRRLGGMDSDLAI